ncbi:Uncharacterized protein FWK35_00018472, partial [Aphis craccivora]
MKSVRLHSALFVRLTGSVENMSTVYKKNIFTYVPLSPPAKLIDCSNFFLNCSSRKFLNIGLDTTNKLNTAIHIIIPSHLYKGLL